MKTGILSFYFIMWGVAAVACHPRQAGITDTSDTEVNEEESRILQIDGVECARCVCFIATKVKNMTGVKDVIDLPAMGMVVIEYFESKVRAETIIETIRQLGFKLEPSRFGSTDGGKERLDPKGGTT